MNALKDMTVGEIESINKTIAEYMKFSKCFPNMIETSELSKMYRYSYMDRVFYDGLYFNNSRIICSEGRYEFHAIGDGNTLLNLDFHKSYDWLMPVVEKIEHLCIVKVIDNKCYIFMNRRALFEDNPIIFTEGETKREAIWLAVYLFIMRLNNENKTKE